MKKKYFALYEVCFLSLMAALVYVFKTFFRTPIGLAGHNGLFWVIPFIVAVGVTKKFGSSTYVGVLTGLLIGTIGMSDEGILKIFEWIALGIVIDVTAYIFKDHLSNLAVGFAVGAFGNIAKFFVNFSLAVILTPNAHIVLFGFAPSLISHIAFGGAGGIIAAVVLNRIRYLKFPNRQEKEVGIQPQKKSQNE